jgi:hypothetical protein
MGLVVLVALMTALAIASWLVGHDCRDGGGTGRRDSATASDPEEV